MNYEDHHVHLRHFTFSQTAVLTALGIACATGNPASADRPSLAGSGAETRLGRVQQEFERSIGNVNAAIEQLNQIEADIARADAQGDQNFFERIAADEFLFIDEAGTVSTKAETIAALDQPRGYNVESLKVDQLTMKLFGDGAIVWGRRLIAGHDGEGRRVEKQFRFTHVFQRSGGLWHITAAHQSRIALTPVAAAAFVATNAAAAAPLILRASATY
jgi:ketosteroid isomerase-like protein